MKCPQCDQTLERVTYEDVPVMQCAKCSGYFVAQNRLTLIRNSRDQNPESLQQEVQTQQQRDSTEQIKCPKCRVDRMKKQKVRLDDENSFLLDVCPRCHHTWFDGGELARLQMKYEQSAKAVDEFARQSRLEQMPEEQRKQLDREIESLEKHEGILSVFGGHKVLIYLSILFLTGTFWSLWYYQSPLWSGAFSGLFAGSLIALCLKGLNDSIRLPLILVASAEACYLAYLVFLY